MSTIYTFHAECSAIDSIASGDKFLVWDTSTGRTLDCGIADIATYLNANPGTFTGLTFNGDSSYTGTASVSFKIGTTLTARIGFYGKAGTSQPASANQANLTVTFANPTTCTAVVGFSTTAQAADVVNTINAIVSCLTANGLWKGAA